MPIVCTLGAVNMGRRAARWQRVLRRNVKAVTEREGGYVLTLDSHERVLAEVRELIDAERVCCAWMTLELRRGNPPTLAITAESSEGVEAIRAIFGLKIRDAR